MPLKPYAKPKKDGSPDYPHKLGLHGRSMLHILDSKGKSYCKGEEWPTPKKLAGTTLVCFSCRDIVEALPKKEKD